MRAIARALTALVFVAMFTVAPMFTLVGLFVGLSLKGSNRG